MSDIEPATPAGKIVKKTVTRATPTRVTAAGRYTKAKSASKTPTSSGAGSRLKTAKPAKRVVEVVEMRAAKPRRKRSREENEKLVAAAKALVVELRNDQKTLPDGI